MSFIRKSKYRHVFGTIAKRDLCYEGVRATSLTLDSNLIKVNDKYLSYIFESGGGGAVAVIPLSQTGRQPNDIPLISGHKNKVTDLDFCPSNSNLLATASEDTVVRVWPIPDGGLAFPGISSGATELVGHGRKVLEIIWNPAVSGVIGSSSADQTIKVWDVENKKAVINFASEHHDVIQSFVWNDEGKSIISQCKDRKVRILDVRAKGVASSADSHSGSKLAKVVYDNQKNWILSTGFGKGSDRQLLGWDVRNITKPIATIVIDQSSGVMIPFFDESTQILYVATKGEVGIRYYEITAERPYIHFISNFTEGVPTRGIAQLPKIYVDAAHCEIDRFYRLTSKNSVEPIGFTVPRRSEQFQLDIFPPTPDTHTPAQTASEYFAGGNKPQRLLVYSEDGKPTYHVENMQREDTAAVSLQSSALSGLLSSSSSKRLVPITSSSSTSTYLSPSSSTSYASSSSSSSSSSTSYSSSSPSSSTSLSFSPASSSSTGGADVAIISTLQKKLSDLEKLDALEKLLLQKDATITALTQQLADAKAAIATAAATAEAKAKAAAAGEAIISSQSADASSDAGAGGQSAPPPKEEDDDW